MKYLSKSILIYTGLYFLILNLGELLKAATFHFQLPVGLPTFYNILIACPLIIILINRFYKNINKNNDLIYFIKKFWPAPLISAFCNSIGIIVYSFVFSDYFTNLRRYNEPNIRRSTASYDTIETAIELINPVVSSIGSFFVTIIGAIISIVGIYTFHYIVRKFLKKS